MTPSGPRRSATQSEIARYIATGESDDQGWYRYPGQSVVEQMVAHSSALRTALAERVIELESAGQVPDVPQEQRTNAFLRGKLRPMVEGLFMPVEQQRVLEFVTDSVVFLTRDNVHQLIRTLQWDHSAWDVARIWLDSIGAPSLSSSSSGLLGFSADMRCYVSLLYFADFEEDPFADYVVHEVAHLFHNNKRHRVGLPPRRRCEWMLDIDFRKRELFAHACEFYSRISRSGADRKQREQLVDVFAPRADGFADQLEPGDLIDVLRTAARARNGWRTILRECSPRTPERATAGKERSS